MRDEQVIKQKDNFDDREAFRAANKDAADMNIRQRKPKSRPKTGKAMSGTSKNQFLQPPGTVMTTNRPGMKP